METGQQEWTHRGFNMLTLGEKLVTLPWKLLMRLALPESQSLARQQKAFLL